MSRGPGSWAASWRTALRISRREVLRHKARNLLIVAMLAMPVFGVTALDTVNASAEQLTAADQLNRTVGRTDAFVQPNDIIPVYQDTTVDAKAMQAPGSVSKPKAITDVLPHATLLPESESRDDFAHGPAGFANIDYYQLDLRQQALSGAFDLISGRAPQTPSEVDLSPRAAAALGAQLGGTVTIPPNSTSNGRAASFTVVGVVQQPDSTKESDMFALPEAPSMPDESARGTYVLNPGGVGWSQVEALNTAGYVVISRDVVLDPPPASQVPYDQQAELVAPSASAEDVASVAITIGIILLEVVLLAGPAFAVSARRREREYAIQGAAGADSRQLRRTVLADGLVLGGIAGIVGAGLGFAGGAASLPLVKDYNGKVPGSVHVDLLHVLGIIMLAMLLGLCAAYVPARGAAKRDIMATLSGRRVASATRRVRQGRVILGVVLAALGLAAVFRGDSVMQNSPTLVIGGVALVEIGGILCTPAVIGLVAKLGRFLPLGPRLALRDSARNLGRTTPAVAAMFAAVAGAVAAGGFLQSAQARDLAMYHPETRANQIEFHADHFTPAQTDALVASLRGSMPVTGSVLATTLTGGANPKPGQPWQFSITPASRPVPGSMQCPAAGVLLAYSPSGNITSDCGSGFGMPSSDAMNIVGGPQLLSEITGFSDQDANDALSRGGIVLFSQQPMPDGQVTIAVRTGTTAKTATVPAVYLVPDGYPNPGFVLSPSAAQTLGLNAADSASMLLVDLAAPVTATQMYAANQALAGLGLHGSALNGGGTLFAADVLNLVILGLATLLAIGAAAIATGLTLADGRADQETLVAVGGSPWTRRWLAGSTALVVTGLGLLIGTPIGLAIADGLIRQQNDGVTQEIAPFGSSWAMHFTVPWLDLGALVVAVPLLTSAGSVLLARSKAPSIGRMAD